MKAERMAHSDAYHVVGAAHDLNLVSIRETLRGRFPDLFEHGDIVDQCKHSFEVVRNPQPLVNRTGFHFRVVTTVDLPEDLEKQLQGGGYASP